MNKNVWHTLKSYLCMQGGLEQDNGHTLVPALRKSGPPSKRTVHKESWTISRRRCCGVRRKRMSDFPCYDSIFQSATEKQRTWKIVDSLCCHSGNKWNFFSHQCFFESAQSLRSSRGDVWRIWNPSRQIGATWCGDGAINCAQCEQDTLLREDGTSQPRGWIQGNTKIGPVLEVTTSCLHGEHGVEIRKFSLSRDNTHSWGVISHGSNEFVMDSNNNDIEVPEDQVEEQTWQLIAKDIVGQTGKSKTTKKRTCWVFIKKYSDGQKVLDWYWTREIFSLCIRNFEETDSSSSSFSTSTSRRGWSGSFLESKRKPSEPIHAVYSLDWRSMESILCSRRRSKKTISVLHWWFRKNHFSELFKDIQDAILLNLFAGQCCDSERILPI